MLAAGYSPGSGAQNMRTDLTTLGTEHLDDLFVSRSAYDGALDRAEHTIKKALVNRPAQKDDEQGASLPSLCLVSELAPDTHQLYAATLVQFMQRYQAAERELGRSPSLDEIFTGLSPRTIAQYVIRCRRILAHLALKFLRQARQVEDFRTEGYLVLQQLAGALTPLRMFLAVRGKKGTRPKASLTNSKQRKKGITARLIRRHPRWEEQVFSAVPDKWRDQVAVLALAGVRPEEIWRGIEVRAVKVDDAACLQFQVSGAKVIRGNASHSDAGHSWRQVAVDEKRCPEIFWYLCQRLVDAQGPVTVSFPSDVKTVEALSAQINRSAKAALGESDVSAYCFRHAFAGDAKAAGYGREILAKAMGHLSDLTQGGYGTRKRSSRWGEFLSAVSASDEVRVHRKEFEQLADQAAPK